MSAPAAYGAAYRALNRGEAARQPERQDDDRRGDGESEQSEAGGAQDGRHVSARRNEERHASA
jgi:hypothetical protein